MLAHRCRFAFRQRFSFLSFNLGYDDAWLLELELGALLYHVQSTKDEALLTTISLADNRMTLY